MENIKAKFFEVYGNLPSSIRDDVVLVIDEKPYSWNTVFVEVNAETKLGDQMLELLNELGIVTND